MQDVNVYVCKNLICMSCLHQIDVVTILSRGTYAEKFTLFLVCWKSCQKRALKDHQDLPLSFLSLSLNPKIILKTNVFNAMRDLVLPKTNLMGSTVCNGFKFPK